jgi:hypothetical protein
MKRITTILIGLALVISANAQFQNSGSMFLRTGSSFMTAPPVVEEPYGIPELHDGHTYIWLENDVGITQSGGAVSAWTDIANGRQLIPYNAEGGTATSANYPSWSSTNGVVFDGNDDILAIIDASMTNYGTVYIVVRQLSWARWDAIYGHPGFNGVNYDMALFSFVVQERYSPEVKMAFSTTYTTNAITTLTLNTWGLLTAEFQNQNQTLQHNDGTPITLTYAIDPNSPPGGFTIGGQLDWDTVGFTNFSNIGVKAVIVRDQTDNSTTKAAIKTYLSNKYLQ